MGKGTGTKPEINHPCCKHAKRTWGQTISMLWVHIFFSVRSFPSAYLRILRYLVGFFSDRSTKAQKYIRQLTTWSRHLLLYVLPSEPHIGSKTAGHTQGQAEKDKMWNRLVQQGTSCLSMLKAVVYPQMMEILPRDFSLQYFTCGISAIRPSTCVGVVPSPGTIVASHHSADRQTFKSNKVDKVWINKKQSCFC